MKKTILTLAASLLIGAAAVYAQDTTRTEQQRDQQTQQDRYRTEGMVEVQVADLPESVSQALKDAKYTGWEEGKVYLDPQSGEYLIEIEKDGQAAQQFRFDRNGNDVTASEKQNQDQSQQNQDQSQQTDPMNQETDSTRQQGQDDQYRQEQQNDEANQNDDAAVQTDSTQQSTEGVEGERRNEQGQVEAETDTTVQNQDQAAQNEDATKREDSAVESQNDNASAQGEDAAVTSTTTERKEVGRMEGHYRVIESTELPQAVVKTLDDDMYGGWKNRTVYLDTKTGDYIVQADPDQNTPGKEGKYYRIGKDGKDISKHRKDKDQSKEKSDY